MSREVCAQAPGKLLIAGEYAVLEPGFGALVTAIDRGVAVRLVAGAAPELTSRETGPEPIPWREARGRIRFRDQPERLRHVASAMELALRHLARCGVRLPPFALGIESRLSDPEGRKYGLGSSAAVSAATVAAILALGGRGLDRGLVQRLASLAHHAAQGSGSGVDVAASVHGGLLHYDAEGLVWAQSQVAAGRDPVEVAGTPWPGPGPRPLRLPPDLQLLVGWTGTPFGTGAALQAAAAYRRDRAAGYAAFLAQSRRALEELVDACRSGRGERAIAALHHARRALVRFGEDAGIDVEPQPLRRLGDAAEAVGGAGKMSGAGGGDCGIALIPAVPALRERLCAMWREAGIIPLELGTAAEGLRVRVTP